MQPLYLLYMSVVDPGFWKGGFSSNSALPCRR